MVSVLFILLLEEWIPVETYHLVCNTSTPKLVADGFGDEQNNLMAA
jgi:hypothetical protein